MSFPDINNSDESNVHRLSWLNGDNSVITDHIIVNGWSRLVWSMGKYGY